MNDTAALHPAELIATLTRLGLEDLLDGFITRERVGIRFLKLERVAAKYGYQFDREHGNLYGKLRLIPTPPKPAKRPIMRLITRCDHAAVHGPRTRRVA